LARCRRGAEPGRGRRLRDLPARYDVPVSQLAPFPWPARSATGVGSMPGTDAAETLAVVLGELPELPFLPELPGRGPGADMIGRTAALLVDMPVETTATGWRLAERRGRDLGRAGGLLEGDLDALEAAAAGYAGVLKIQLCGPWTLAASLTLTHSMEPALADAGAVADLAASLAEGAAAHAADVRRRVPDAELIVQFDEPVLPGVLAGSVPTASGLRRVPAVDEPVAADNLRSVLEQTQAPAVIHCCAGDVPWDLIAASGARGVSFDLALVQRRDEDAIGEIAEAGLGCVIGALPATEQGHGRPARAEDHATAVIRLWDRIGLPLGGLSEQVVITPACGLAGVSPARARELLAQCQEVARLLPEMIEEGVR
jgi:cobalamin-independent methionine synthase catalytic subunit